MAINRFPTREAAIATGGTVAWVIDSSGKNWEARTGTDAALVPPARTITTEAFRDRFLPAELAAIVAATDAQIRVALLKLSTKEQPTITLDNPEVIATMARLVTLGLITPARSAEILA